MDAALNWSAGQCRLHGLTFHFRVLLTGPHLTFGEDVTLDTAQDQCLLSKQAN